MYGTFELGTTIMHYRLLGQVFTEAAAYEALGDARSAALMRVSAAIATAMAVNLIRHTAVIAIALDEK